MKKITRIVIASIGIVFIKSTLPPTAAAQQSGCAPVWPAQWIRQFGTSGEDQARGIAVGTSGVYVSGFTQGALPGQTSAGDGDAFVRKYDSEGNEVWTRQFGTPGTDLGTGIAVNGSGVYVIGPTKDAYFLRKYDAEGNEIWTRQVGIGYNVSFNGIALDASGVYVTGSTNGPLPGQTHFGYHDAFVRRYDFEGNEVWTREFGTPDDDGASAISADASGVYLAGFTSGAPPPTYVRYNETFVRKFDVEGNEVWARQFRLPGNAYWGGAPSARPGGISVADSRIYLVGVTDGAFPGQVNLGYSDVFVRQYDAHGNEVWTRQVGTSASDDHIGVSVDASGVYMVGYTSGAFPGCINAGSWDFFALKYDADGNEVWTRQFGTPDGDFVFGNGVSVDAAGGYMAGIVRGPVPGQTGAGGWDAVVLKLFSDCATVIDSITPNITPMPVNTSVSLTTSYSSIGVTRAIIKWGDGTLDQTICNPATTFTAEHIYSIPGVYKVTIILIDACSESNDPASIEIIINCPNTPVINMVTTSNTPVPVNTPVNLNITYTGPPATTALIKWGDGTDQTISNPLANFTTTHAYSTPGVYTASVTLTDACAKFSTPFNYQYIVIYDPSDGFVTGSGWISSPAGAYRPDVSLSGKGIVGFESKYQKGTTVPSGNTEFKFHAADMNFKSSNYDWLVVSGSRAQYKGTGTINGDGNYGFLLTAVDGNLKTPMSPDLFRIKIWDKDNDDAIIYDNQYGASDDASLTTQLDGGSILIHTSKSNAANITTVANDAGNGEQTYLGELRITAQPNPSGSSFFLKMQSSSGEPLRIKVLDIWGRMVETRNNVAVNANISIGQKYSPGVYFVEVMQGTDRRMLKLIKQ